MMKEKPLATALSNVKFKPSLNVTARMSGEYDSIDGDNSWRKRDIQRLREEIKSIDDELAHWDHEKVGERAKKSLETEKAVKRARLLEHEAYIGSDKGKPAGVEGKGAVVGGPYEIVKSGSKWLVKNMEKGTTKGTFNSRAEAMKQFRLLEGIEHGWSPSK